jgi:hypothetical protein
VQWRVNQAFRFKTINHAGSKMLCVGGGGAITTTEDFVAVEQDCTSVIAAREMASGSASAAAIWV